MNKIFLLLIILAVAYVMIFLVPNRVEMLSLDPEKISEIWRFITYPFTHLNTKHLAENVVGVALLSFIAFELKTGFREFTSAYMSSGFLSALPVWFLFPFVALGASNAILGGFGFISRQTKTFKINGWIIIVLLIGLLSFKTILLYLTGNTGAQFITSLKQTIAHLSGLFFGIGFFYFFNKIQPVIDRKKLRILRGD